MATANAQLEQHGFRITRCMSGSWYGRDGLLISGDEPGTDAAYAPTDPNIRVVVMHDGMSDGHKSDKVGFYPNTQAAIAAGFATPDSIGSR